MREGGRREKGINNTFIWKLRQVDRNCVFFIFSLLALSIFYAIKLYYEAYVLLIYVGVFHDYYVNNNSCQMLPLKSQFGVCSVSVAPCMMKQI